MQDEEEKTMQLLTLILLEMIYDIQGVPEVLEWFLEALSQEPLGL
jgi:hypothetical protein